MSQNKIAPPPYTSNSLSEAELVAQHAPKPIEQPAAHPVKPKKKKPAQAAPRDETPYSVLAYNETILGRTLTDQDAKKARLKLAAMGRAREIEPGKVDHPVWKQINTWPKYLLDKFYAKSLADIAKGVLSHD